LVSSTEEYLHTLDLPDGVEGALEGRSLKITGPLGSVTKNFWRIPVNVKTEGSKLRITPYTKKKKDVVTANTATSLIRNMIHGVTKGFTYKLKIIFAHFPVTVKVKGDEVIIENFMGERSARTAKIIGDCKVTIQGDDIIIKGVSNEEVGQSAANLEQATKVKRKDQRIFLDGIYIYEKIRA
jgi:large subunit ribosomal protein L6